MKKFIKMPKALHEKWDAALRSGQYKQGFQALSNSCGTRYCCLGVLQMVVDGEVERQCNSEPAPLPSAEWCGANGISFRKQVSIRDDGVAMVDGGNAFMVMVVNPLSSGLEVEELAVVNDTLGKSFIEIADILKCNIEYTDA